LGKCPLCNLEFKSTEILERLTILRLIEKDNFNFNIKVKTPDEKIFEIPVDNSKSIEDLCKTVEIYTKV
jgi:hypothetical protein